MTTCSYIKRAENDADYFCFAEKSLLLTDFILLVCMSYLSYVVMRNHAKRIDLKIFIVMLSLINGLYVFYHYGI